MAPSSESIPHRTRAPRQEAGRLGLQQTTRVDSFRLIILKRVHRVANGGIRVRISGLESDVCYKLNVAISPADRRSLAFFKHSRIPALLYDNEAFCAVRNLRRRSGQQRVIVIVVTADEDRACRIAICDRIYFQSRWRRSDKRYRFGRPSSIVAREAGAGSVQQLENVTALEIAFREQQIRISI